MARTSTRRGARRPGSPGAPQQKQPRELATCHSTSQSAQDTVTTPRSHDARHAAAPACSRRARPATRIVEDRGHRGFVARQHRDDDAELDIGPQRRLEEFGHVERTFVEDARDAARREEGREPPLRTSVRTRATVEPAAEVDEIRRADDDVDDARRHARPRRTVPREERGADVARRELRAVLGIVRSLQHGSVGRVQLDGAGRERVGRARLRAAPAPPCRSRVPPRCSSGY